MSSQTQHILVKKDYPKLLSIVIPMYNEEEMIPLMRPAMEAFLKEIKENVELILINDGSKDKTVFLLSKWAQEDKRVKLLSLSRNFGHQVAVSAGLDYAKGDAIVIIDADLQDPLEAIHQMIQKYEEGFHVVYGRRTMRTGETKFKLLTAWAFYRLMKKLVHPDLPTDVGDFRLISKEFLLEYRKISESNRFIRGLIAWCGFPQTFVDYVRAPRAAGETKYPLSKMLKFAWNAALSFSPLPMKMFLGLGSFVVGFGFLFAFYAIGRYFYKILVDSHIEFSSGWTSLIVLLCIFSGTIMLGIGILGEYISRIFTEVKGRPYYYISYKENVD